MKRWEKFKPYKITFFIFFAVLFFLFALSYALYALPAMAFLYACYILKGTLFPRQKREKK
jgi:hypothetical protein